MKSFIITGGTGVLGNAVAAKLNQKKADFITISRHKDDTKSYDQSAITRRMEIQWQYADLATGNGLTSELMEKSTIIHLASGMGMIGKVPAEIIFIRNLIREAVKARAEHLVYISIVGIDKIPLPYYQAKLQTEEIIRNSGIPFTILRATQFHNFMEHQVKNLLKLPVAFFPKGLLFQPIQLEAVGALLVELASGNPRNETLQIGGPKVQTLSELTAVWQKIQQIRKPHINIPAFGATLKAFQKGYATCPETSADSVDWECYLRDKYLRR